VAYVVLAALLVARAILYRSLFVADVTNHAKGFAFLTTVAGTNVLGAASVVIHGWYGVAWVLWWLSIVLWAAFLYATLIAVVIRSDKPGLESGINGTWFLLTVATESIAVLAALLLVRDGGDLLAFAALAAFTLGVTLYLIVMTMVFLRWTFMELDPTEADPPAWIAAGAVAITVLAGSNLLLVAPSSPRIDRVASFIEGIVVLAWATATFWFPLMVAIGVVAPSRMPGPPALPPLLLGPRLPPRHVRRHLQDACRDPSRRPRLATEGRLRRRAHRVVGGRVRTCTRGIADGARSPRSRCQ
jgi:tellurite resistance protein TehA-like permease